MDLKEMGCDARNWMGLAQDRQAYVQSVMNIWVP